MLKKFEDILDKFTDKFPKTTFILRLYQWKLDKLRQIKWFFQRTFRGYDDCDLWNLDSFIVRKITPAFKAFVKHQKEHGSGCPGTLWDKENEDHCHKWIKALETMEESFELILAEDDVFFEDIEEYFKNMRKIDKGLKLFGKYFRALWD